MKRIVSALLVALFAGTMFTGCPWWWRRERYEHEGRYERHEEGEHERREGGYGREEGEHEHYEGGYERGEGRDRRGDEDGDDERGRY